MILTFKKRLLTLLLPALVLVGGLVITPSVEARMSKGGQMGGSQMGGRAIFEGAPSEMQCRLCHGGEQITPHPTLGVANQNRHHARIGTPIVGLAYGTHDTVAPGDVSTGEYQCMSCHSKYNEETQEYNTLFTRDCLDCHSANSVTGRPGRGSNVHHYTQTFSNRDCSSCHSYLKD